MIMIRGIAACGAGRGMLAAVVALGVVLAGCQNGTGTGIGPKATIGGLGGAAGGGLIAAAAGGGGAAIAAGVILGGLIGGGVGTLLDQNDKRLANQAAQRALETAPSGQATTWHNPDSGKSGSVTPTRTYQAADGTYCREYQQDIVIGGKKQQSYGTACRQPDGTWKIVS
jgi:surface antigen